MSRRCLGCMELFGDEFEICPHCGYIVGTHAEEAIHMETGTILHDRYIVGKVLGFGGFGVTYIGWDGKLEQKVAIKEYLPGEFSTRMPGQSQVTVFNGEKSDQFRDGLKKFVEEAKRLAKFQNEPGIVKIFDSFEENETAYIIMEYLDGETLTSYLKRERTIPEDQTVAMLMPVMESLKAVHAEGLLHRDIAPDNIFLTKSGEVKLIDFGASRYATTSHSRSLTVIIKPGFSPEEQYRSRGDQGPYTDVYAIAATMYKMITGKTPPDAMERRAKYENQSKDILEEPHKINKDISINRENAILNAMNVRIEDRTQDVAAFINELNANPPVKRRYGKIKKIDIYSWPLWVKILLPTLLAAVITFGLFLLTGVINFSRYTKEVVIPDNIVIAPDVEGLYKDEAITSIENNDLLAFIGGSIESEYIAAGKIIMQTPVGGAFLEKNGAIILTISSGNGVEEVVDNISTVPYLIGDTKENAIEKLKKAGLGEPIIEEVNDENISAGLVISSSIESGEKVEVGTILTLKVSLGPAAFSMPNVVGQQESNAKSTLENCGLVVTVEYEKSNDVPEGNVIRQSVAENTDVKRGDAITIVVSSGEKTVEVSDVVGKTQKEAEDILDKQGFAVYVRENPDEDVPKGYVISQSPAAGTSQKEGSTITIYVSTGKKDITVSFNANGGSVSTSSAIVHANDNYGDLPTPSRDGYTFNGWYTAQDGGTVVTSSAKVTEISNHTLYAHWIPNQYSVQFDANGGSVSKQSISVTYDLTYGDLPTPTRNGYGFDGWFTAASGGTQVSSGTQVTIISAQTLYAHWSAGRITVTFDANGGTTTIGNTSVAFDGTYGDLPTPVRAGYNFAGWFTAAGGGSQVTSSTKVTNSAAHTLYAHWTAATYKVTLDANGGAVASSSVNVTYNSSYGNLPTPTREGYSFNGWFTAVSGGTKVTSDTKVSVTADQTLYAQWSLAKYTLTFNANGGSVSEASRQVLYSSEYGTLPVPTRTGYSFDGWYTAQNGGSAVISSTKVTQTSNHTLYAHWIPNKYSVQFDANGGAVSTSGISVTYDSTYGDLPTPTRSGYGFDGWFTAASGGTQISSATKVTITSTQTLYAHWSAGKITVTFDANGGTTATGSTTVAFDGTYGTLPTPTRAGYDFAGWFTAASGGSQVSSSTKVTNSAAHTLYAHWTAATYKVTLNANGGSVSSSSVNVTYNSSYGNLPTPTRTGYSFNGWFTAASGGTKVTSNTKVSITADQTLYAQWSLATYTITFNANGGSVSPSSTTVTYGSTYGTLPTPTRTGYTFNGWYTAASGGTKITSTTTVSITSAQTLYAQWALETYKVSWNTGTGYSITVSRTSSPNAGASTGTLSSGAIVYYGDVLSVNYTANTGYSLGSKGSTSITVTGNVTSSVIYASAKVNSYTYNIVYKSSNGTALGTATATYNYGTTNTITPKAFSGYTTPSSQSVVWDSVTAKTITFVYTPASVAFTNKSGTIAADTKGSWLTYSATVEYQNRTTNSVQIRIIWTSTIAAYYYDNYGQKFRASVGSVSTGEVQVTAFGTWQNWTSQARGSTGTSGWITVPLNTTSATALSLNIYYYQTNYNNTDMTAYDGAAGLNQNWTINIPAY